MKPMVVLCLLVLLVLGGTHSAARLDLLPSELKAKLEKGEHVFVDVSALTDKGPIEPGPLTEVVVRKLQEVGYSTVTDRAQPHDVVFSVTCEQRKLTVTATASGGDADLPDSPSRSWKGPACLLTYQIEGKRTGWIKEVRTDFQDAKAAAEVAKAGDPGAYAMAKLRERLEDYDFPILVAAEWGQARRLLRLLDDPKTAPARKVKIVSLLGEMSAEEALPRLVTALKDPDVGIAGAAAVAIGTIGRKESIPVLLEVLTAGRLEVRAAAAKGLGKVAALHGESSVVPALIEALQSQDPVLQAEAAWALGKVPDRRAYEPLAALSKSLQDMRSDDPKLRRLREAVAWSFKQLAALEEPN
ncbi:HEAT repeat domain-containing protein [Nitrospira sp. Kam-Ns4a]